MVHYNGDMMHCNEHQCKKKDQCYRYWLGQHATGLVSMYKPKEPVTDGCNFYINVKYWE